MGEKMKTRISRFVPASGLSYAVVLLTVLGVLLSQANLTEAARGTDRGREAGRSPRAEDGIPRLRWVDAGGRVPLTRAEFMERRPVRGTLSIELVDRIGLCGAASGPERSEEEASDTELVVLVINSSLYTSVGSKLVRYANSIAEDGTLVEIYLSSEGTPEELRDFLSSRLASGLVGAVLIGDLPVPWYEIPDPYDHDEFPADLYYMDLDGRWYDRDGDGIFDEHTNGSGDQAPEIYVGRLTASPLGLESGLVKNYFEKNNRYRNCQLGCNERALVYIDDDWDYWTGEWSSDIAPVYPDRVVISEQDATVADDYRVRLEENYEWIQVHVHSSPAMHSFQIGHEHIGGEFYATEIPGIDPTALFYNLFACSNARYVEEGYMAGEYVFANWGGLAAIGSTKSGAMLEFDKFYRPLSEGKSLGRAFLDWFQSLAPFSLDEQEWHYGMTLIGDPTLRILSLDADGDGLDPCEGDCDDGNPDVGPESEEIPFNGIDDDCDPSTLDDDGDGDGWPVSEDCDDTDPMVSPDAPELCEGGIDEDCDGRVDGDDPACGPGCTDADGDDYRAEGGLCGPVDCDDLDADIHPGAGEICDAVDNDCDGSPGPDETDGDDDGWMGCEGDCDDVEGVTFPGAPEMCDGKDNDCDGSLPPDEADADADGWSECSGDCDDGNPDAHPAHPEIQKNGIDDDCDGMVDEICFIASASR